jgi:N utilization substance protein B
VSESPRRRSRAAALQVLFSLEFAWRGEEVAAAQEVFDEVAANFELPEGARAFAKELVLGVANHRAELDALLSEHAKNWRLERMASVDRNVLRIGAYELVHGDAPTPVVIDEAVELARRFGGERSPAFVNGVLDAAAAHVRPPEPRRARQRESA